jgi:hypothetical protein
MIEIARRECAERIFDTIIPAHALRLHNRLESPQWQRPTYHHGRKDPFIPKLIDQVDKMKFKDVHDEPATEIQRLKESVRELGDMYKMLLPSDSNPTVVTDETNLLKKIAKQANAVTSSLGRRTLETALKERRPQVATDENTLKVVRQLDKMGRYWSACKSLSCLARSMASSFQLFTFEAVPPFASPFIANKKRYVHAEIQLLVFLSINQFLSRPRSIGVNKAACYLCDLFITGHRDYFVSGTHGTLMEQWRFPNASELNPKLDDATVDRFRTILHAMRAELHRLIAVEWPPKMYSRRWPMQSRVFDTSRSPARLSGSSLSNTMQLDDARISEKLREVRSHESLCRKDAGYQTGPPETDLSTALPATEKDAADHFEESKQQGEFASESRSSPEGANMQAMGESVTSRKSSNSSLGSTLSTVDFRSSTDVESSRVISKGSPAKFECESLCLHVQMKDGDVPNHETIARVCHLRGVREIAARLSDDSQMPVIDWRNLLPGKECVIPIPETASGRGITFILGKSPTFNEAMYLELKVCEKTETLV